MTMNFLKKFIFNDDRDKRKTLAKKIIKGRESDIKEIRKVNRRVRMLIGNGSIEVTIRNVNGVIRECGKKKR
jgi:hypothetical protein